MSQAIHLIYSFIRRCVNIFINTINLKILSNVRIGFREIFYIKGIIRVYGNGYILLGKNVKINSRFSANPIGGQSFTSFYVNKSGHLDIGDNVGISNSSITSFCSIIIEENVFIGADCKIYDTDFHSINNLIRNSGNDVLFKSLPIVIKRAAFIGAGSIILKGVTVGENSVIGAGSVVTKSIPCNEIWGGNPAKFIRAIEVENV